LSFQVSRGTSTSGGQPGTSLGIATPNTGSSWVGMSLSVPEWIASTMARVCGSFIRLPIPYGPPDQPVLTSQTCAPCFWIFCDSSSAYLVGCQTRNGPPKQGEKVACGSFTSTSVPATLAVYPLMKWYIACAGVSFATGGRTPNASA